MMKSSAILPGWKQHRRDHLKEKELWLFDLAHGNITDDAILEGFIAHYALQNMTMENVQQDLHFHTFYGDHYAETAMSSLRNALEACIKKNGR